MNSPYAFAEGFKQRLAPAAWCVGRCLLIRLLICFRKEPHVVNVSINELLDRDDELDIPIGLEFLHREMMKLGEFVCRFDLRKGPI